MWYSIYFMIFTSNFNEMERQDPWEMGVWPGPNPRLDHDDAQLLRLTLFEAVQVFGRTGRIPIGEDQRETSLFALDSDATIQGAEGVAVNVSEVRQTVIPHAWIHKESAEPGLARSCGGRVIAS